MTDVLDNIASESSDNEEISRLFPKCKPRVTNDVNLNKIFETNNCTHDIGNTNNSEKSSNYETFIMNNNECNFSYHWENLSSQDNMDIASVKRLHLNMHPIEKSFEHTEDASVISAYDVYGADCVSHELVDYRRESSGDLTREDDSDDGLQLGNQSEFRLRESKIEIAGGKELFSSSRSRLTKKRYSDDNHCNSKACEKEGHNCMSCSSSIDGQHEDKCHRFTSGNSKLIQNKNETPNECEQNSQSINSTFIDCDKKIESETISGYRNIPREQDFILKSQKSGLLVYETHVKGSEIVYDDIGDWAEENVSRKKAPYMHAGSESEISTQDGLDNGDIFCKTLSVSTEAVNSEDFLSERDDVSPQGISSPTLIGKPFDKKLDSLQDHNLKLISNRESLTRIQNDELSSSGELYVENVSQSTQGRVAKVIGNVPIAEYEGSPRRYGPRPGHPHRIFNESNEDSNDKIRHHKELQMKEDDDLITLDKLNVSSLQSSEDTLLHNHNGKSGMKDDASSIQTDSQRSESSFDVCYGESQTQKVLEEFYKQDIVLLPDSDHPVNNSEDFKDLEYQLHKVNSNSSYVGKRLAQFHIPYVEDSPKKISSDSFSIPKIFTKQMMKSPTFSWDSVVKPQGASELECDNVCNILCQDYIDTIDHDLDTVSTNPDTEDLAETEMGEQVGQSRNFTLSPETTECESNDVESEVSFENEGSLQSESRGYGSMPVLEDGLSSGQASDADDVENQNSPDCQRFQCDDNPATLLIKRQILDIENEIRSSQKLENVAELKKDEFVHQEDTTQAACSPVDLDYLDPLKCQASPPPPAPIPHRKNEESLPGKESVDEAIKEIKQAILKTKSIMMKTTPVDKVQTDDRPVWVLRPSFNPSHPTEDSDLKSSGKEKQDDAPEEECDTDQETDRLLGKQRIDDKGFYDDKDKESHKKKGRPKEVLIHEPAVLIEGVLFRARYLGSTQLVCEGQPTKATRMMQAEEAVSRIKAPEGESQPSTEVDLFISTEKIMVLNTDLKEIMMDHSLRTISYIADIGDLVVLMARRRMIGCQDDQDSKVRRTPKMICHVFESEEAQFIAQSIGQAFQVAYMEFLKANGIEDHSFVKEMDYQEVLNSQEIYGDELEMFAKKEMQKEVIVPKGRGEILGVVIVESGWGSMLPTVVIANLSPNGAAARCGQLNIGDQIIAINGISLVGLPLSTCQNYIKNSKNQMVVKLTVVPCAPVVEVKIKRPDTKYQLGFSVQNGVICSLLRGGIAERGGVRVGHRIIEINGQSVVAVPHERIVNLLATSIGEILMKTMPTSMFRLLTGQETPIYI